MREQVRRRAAWLGGALTILLLLPIGCSSDGRSPAVSEPLSPAASEPPPADVMAAQAVVLRLQAELIAVMREASELGFLGRYERLDRVARETFDLPLMARRTFGSGWRELTPDRQELWIETFERFHISSIADIRDRYQNQEYRLLGWERPMQDVVRVKSILDFPGRAVDLYVDYRVRSTSLGWRIVDLHQPPAVSEVAMRRAEYQVLLERRGFDGLIAEMNERIARRGDS